MKEKQIVVYFNSGNKERFSLNEVRFVEQYPGKDAFDDGRTVINWDNVCFVREWIKPDEFDL